MNTGKICKETAKCLLGAAFVGSIIIGIDYGFDFFLYGAVCSFVFYISLYALGEIVERLTEIANNTSYSKKLYDLLSSKETDKSIDVAHSNAEKREPIKSEHKWMCNSCGKLRDKSPCPYCGNE